MSIDERIAEIAVEYHAHSSGAYTPLCDIADAIRAALSDPIIRREICGWRPIESAPKDGTEISVAFKSVGVRQVSWQDPYGDDDDCALWCVDDNKHGPYPLRGYSHGDELGWMPLPEPPEGK